MVPCSRISPPHTPHGSARSSAAARHCDRIGQSAHSALARSRSAGLSANHRSASATWHGSASLRASTSTVIMCPFTCFLFGSS
ncbi:Uncharacterised protein [Mycobacteroides abscessus subsp. abscessus]|nr:Uncharacterised protein [Mycobacteroides abscessus subsp. abscessus]